MFESLQELLKSGAALKVDKAGQPSGEDLQVAVAVLLISVAGSDTRFDSAEFETLFRTMAKQFEIADAVNVQLLEIADFLKRDKGKLDDFAQIVNERFDSSQKRTVLAMLLRVVVADGVVTDTEKSRLTHVMSLLSLEEEDLKKAEELVTSGAV